MLEGKQVAVVVPARDEEALLPETLAGIPDFVDRVYVVDDGSKDGTAAVADGNDRVALIRHEQSAGVGAAIVSGYRRALEDGVDVVAVMAADNQMDPADLETLRMLDLDRLYARYGFPNDLLVHLNVWNRRVRDYPSRPIYGVGERSGIRLWKVVPTISWLLFKGFFWRLGNKYVIRDFHPLVLFWALGIVLFLAGFALGLVETVLRLMGNTLPAATIVLVALLVISGLQLLLFAMWFDMESNKDLR